MSKKKAKKNMGLLLTVRYLDQPGRRRLLKRVKTLVEEDLSVAETVVEDLRFENLHHLVHGFVSEVEPRRHVLVDNLRVLLQKPDDVFVSEVLEVLEALEALPEYDAVLKRLKREA